jgi:uncharacterized protein YecE (DUF72 family)
MEPDTTQAAHDAIAAVAAAGHELIGAVANELNASAQQSEQKDQLIASLLGTNHPQTGKPFSATSAEDFAKSLPEYRAAVELTHAAIVRKVAAEQALAVAKLRARLAVALVEQVTA